MRAHICDHSIRDTKAWEEEVSLGNLPSFGTTYQPDKIKHNTQPPPVRKWTLTRSCSLFSWVRICFEAQPGFKSMILSQLHKCCSNRPTCLHPTSFSFLFFTLVLFEMMLLCVLAVLELKLYTRLASNSKGSPWLCLWSAGIKVSVATPGHDSLGSTTCRTWLVKGK